MRKADQRLKVKADLLDAVANDLRTQDTINYESDERITLTAREIRKVQDDLGDQLYAWALRCTRPSDD